MRTRRRHSGSYTAEQRRFDQLKDEFTRVFGDLKPRGSDHLREIIANLARLADSQPRKLS